MVRGTEEGPRGGKRRRSGPCAKAWLKAYHTVLGSKAQGEAGEKRGRGRQRAPTRGLSQAFLRLILTSTPQRRQGQRRKLRPRAVTESQRQSPHQKPPARENLSVLLPSMAKASVLSPGLAAGSVSDLRAWQAVMMSCMCRKLATASTSSTFSELRLSLAVYMNSSTCPRPAKDTDGHHGLASRPGASGLPSCSARQQDPGIGKKQGGGHRLPISCAGREAGTWGTCSPDNSLQTEVHPPRDGRQQRAWTPTLHRREA